MTPGTILEHLTARGIRLQRNGESLVAIPKAARQDVALDQSKGTLCGG
jgi:hypothetical protein